MLRTFPMLNLFGITESSVGNDTYKVIANRIKLSKYKYDGYNHRIFNKRCLQGDIISKYLLVKPLTLSRWSIQVAQRTLYILRIH